VRELFLHFGALGRALTSGSCHLGSRLVVAHKASTYGYGKRGQDFLFISLLVEE